MLFTPAQYLAETNTAPKARALAMLLVEGFQVPPFVVLSEKYLKEDIAKNIDAITESVPSALYAVRFAAQYEDTDATSQAGRYQTRLAVPKAQLQEAIFDVVKSSCAKLAQGEPFVVIVQAYVSAEVSGVAFTRHPESVVCMRIEYAKGSGGVVGGGVVDAIDITPESALKILPKYVSDLVIQMKRIERLFGCPQDIEWCYRDGVVSILQSRPITTISKEAWQAIQSVDAAIKGKQCFHYTTDVIGESYQEPRPLDYSLLQALYQEGGPVSRAYARLGVRYIPTEHVQRMGNRVFIDKEKEYRMLLPAFSLGLKGTFVLKYFPLGELFVTAMNKVALEKALNKPIWNEVIQDLLQMLARPFAENQTLSETLQIVLRDFETIYLINYLSQISQERKIQLTEKSLSLIKKGFPEIYAALLEGNSLSLDDVSVFSYTPLVQPEGEGEIEVEQLRELGRWHSVRLANSVRKAVAAQEEVVREQDKESIHFATVGEIFAGNVDRGVLRERRRVYEAHMSLPMSANILSFISNAAQSFSVISEGEAVGTLVTLADSEKVSGKKILYVPTLSPGLVEHFSRYAGIVVSQGGVLSHAAIVAREQKVPVVLHSGDISTYLGKEIKIGSEGVSFVES